MANPRAGWPHVQQLPRWLGPAIVNDNLIAPRWIWKAGIEVFNHGSGERWPVEWHQRAKGPALWFGYYWGPTHQLATFDMTKVSLGEEIEAAQIAHAMQIPMLPLRILPRARCDVCHQGFSIPLPRGFPADVNDSSRTDQMEAACWHGWTRNNA